MLLAPNNLCEQSTAVKQAYEHCQQIARQHYENFPTASLLIAPHLRPAIAAIYAFARHADDIADEGDADTHIRLRALFDWQRQLQECVHEQHNKKQHPIFIALRDTIECHNLSLELLNDLLLAFIMDTRVRSMNDMEMLLGYCRHSANPIGRLVLALHGIDNPKALAASDAICTALQLSNFWQDLSVDIANDRSYLPDCWLTPYCGEDVLQNKYANSHNDNYMPALKIAIDYTDALFEQGMSLLPYLPWRLRLQIAATINGGRAILYAVKRSETPFTVRPSLSKYSWFVLSIAIIRDTLKSYKSTKHNNKK